MEIKKYFGLLIRWWWLIVLAILISGGAAYIVSRNTAPVYRATAKMLIDVAPGGNAGNDYAQVLLEQKLAATYIELLQARPVLGETIERLNLPYSTTSLNSRVSVSAPQETQILVISVEDNSAALAADIANTLTKVFSDENQNRQSQRYAATIKNRQAEKDDLEGQIEEVEIKINQLNEIEELTAEEQADLSRLETQLRELQILFTANFNELEKQLFEQSRDTNNLVIYESAISPQRPIRPTTSRNTLLAGIVGAMLAVGFIFLIDYLDDTVKSPDDILADSGLSTLGVIAEIEKIEEDALVTHRTPRAPISEAFRVMRTNLGFSAVDNKLDSILVTSSSPGEGKSTISSNMAIVMAQTGKRVILVDADLRLPVQHNLFSLPNNQGLTTALLDTETPVVNHLQQTKVPGLSLLASGPLPPNPAELLNSYRMADIIKDLNKSCDLIIFDTPPVLTVADSAILGRQVSGCMLVAEVGKTNRSAIMRALEGLAKSESQIYGIVLNKLQPSRLGAYDYYYHYQYYSYDQNNRQPAHRRNSKLPAWLSWVTNKF